MVVVLFRAAHAIVGVRYQDVAVLVMIDGM
jgi:hypothetical protein